jgi:NAD(P)-dependent dehydrogenase (short-subunit alcohol dehydrogenase family)
VLDRVGVDIAAQVLEVLLGIDSGRYRPKMEGCEGGATLALSPCKSGYLEGQGFMGERLKGKTAIITGAGSGIGAATAELFVGEGALVLVVDRNADTALATAQRVSPNGQQAQPLSSDVSNEADIQAMVSKALDLWGHIDILVNNAGVRSDVDIQSFTPEEFDRVFGANLKGPLLCCKHVLPTMLEHGRGSIVNITSISSTCGIPGQPLYAPSKGGLLQMTRQLAVEFAGRGIRVNAVSPGTIETPLLGELPTDRSRWSDEHKWLLAQHPIGRFGRPAEVAAAILFLASDEASFITGANLAVDGGYAAQ